MREERKKEKNQNGPRLEGNKTMMTSLWPTFYFTSSANTPTTFPKVYIYKLNILTNLY